MMAIFLTLLLGHLLADFPLQTNWLVHMKQKSRWGVTAHVLIHVGVTALLLKNPSQHAALLASLGAAHWVIDTIKMRSETVSNLRGFVLDQAAHLGCLSVATAIVTQLPVASPEGVLTLNLLFTANLFALIVSSMVMLWVWACCTGAETLLPQRLVRWTQRQMLTVSQRAGIVLVGGVAVKLIF